MESAIPSHLQCPRTRPVRASEDYTPPYPSWVARIDPSVKQVAIAYLGVQYRGTAAQTTARRAILRLKELAARVGGPPHHDVAYYKDGADVDTLVFIAYWSDPIELERWLALPELMQWWAGEDRVNDGVGWFREIICPGIDRFETLFSTPDSFEGVGVLAKAMSGEIQEHAYWGGMRDRFPISQVDALRTAGSLLAEGLMPGRVRVRGIDNLALIRSGQEWTDTSGREREIYLREVEPVLREGMDFLRDHGPDIGCFTNRYMYHVTEAFEPLEKTFGVSCWQSLEHMERWAESHPTHLQIFGSFMKMVQAMNFDLKLRLYHEVAVVPAHDQNFEYINCHSGTGLLRCAKAG